MFDLTSWFVTWAQKKGGGYIWVPQILITEKATQDTQSSIGLQFLVNKSLNTYTKQTKLNFSNWLQENIAFLRRFLPQTATWWPNRKNFTSSVIEILKVMIDTIFWGLV